MKLTLNAISKWVAATLLLALFSLSGGMAWADIEATEPSEAAIPIASPSAKPFAQPKGDESESSSDSEDSSDEDSNQDDGAAINEEQIDLDAAREALELRYENPADVALPPKILVPNDDLIAAHNAKVGAEPLKQLPFNVFQLRHERRDLKPGMAPTGGLTSQKQAAQLDVIPVNIDDVQIPTQTPADEFFTQASVVTAGLGSSAIALSAFVFMRARRKEQGDL